MSSSQLKSFKLKYKDYLAKNIKPSDKIPGFFENTNPNRKKSMNTICNDTHSMQYQETIGEFIDAHCNQSGGTWNDMSTFSNDIRYRCLGN